ncbi:MAG: MFS transporter [Bryobacteraceae bacterium]
MIERTFRAFKYHDFRVMWLGACTSSVGTAMQQLAQSWLVYTLSGSPFYLGLDVFLGQVPIFLLSLIGGVYADRRDRRTMLLISQYVQMSCAFLLALLFFTNVVHVWHILCLSFVVGIAQAFGGPAYSALIPTLVDPEDLPNAIAMNSIQFNLARIIGPVLGGLALNKLGAVWCFGLNGMSFVAVIFSLYTIKVKFIPARTSESVLTSMKQGISFIRAKPGMDGLIVLAFVMTVLALPLLTFLPVFAKEVLHGNEQTFTILLILSGAGSITGALLVAALQGTKYQGRRALMLLIALGVLISGFALSGSLPLSATFLFLCGGVMMGVFALVSSLVQAITADSMRGRVMSVYNMAFRGGMPIGSLLLGALIPIFTAPYVLASTGILLAIVGTYFLFVHRKIAEL